MVNFEKICPENTAPAIDLALDAALELGCCLVVATTTGQSALQVQAAARARDFRGGLVVVTHVYGMKGPGENSMLEAVRAELAAGGARLVTAAHALSGAERGLSRRFQGVYPAEIMAHTLRMLSQGVKVCVEVGAMALDAGQLPFGSPAVVLGGTGRGLDTACVLTPGYSADILSTRIHRIVCMPW